MSGWVDDDRSGGGASGGGWAGDGVPGTGRPAADASPPGGRRRRRSRRERKQELEARRAALRAAGIATTPAGLPVADGTADGQRRWRAAKPELVIAGIAVAAVALAAAALAGWPGVVAVAASVTVITLIVLRTLIPRSAGQSVRVARDKQVARSIYGYAQRRFVVEASVRTRPMYESDLRPVLEHILAARLAESRGINLYTEPAAARSAFCRTRADEALWPWIDPEQVLDADARARHRHGIPSRTLARLIDRLEAL